MIFTHFVTTSLAIAALALIVERFLGWPAFAQRLVGHPVEWIGALIGRLDRAFNRERHGEAARRFFGVAALAIVLGSVLIVTVPLAGLLRGLPGGWLLEALLCVPLFSQKSLATHVRAVGTALGRSLEAARQSVAHIIGRDPKQLEPSQIAAGAIESLAENTSDGITAPLFWLIIGGLPGIALYKALNTADSMIGYRSERHRHFGWASARLDDLANLVPARATALLFAASAMIQKDADAAAAWRAARRDAPHHVSPNAGWPEAAMAGALGLKLGGPRSYGGRHVELAAMGDGRSTLDADDVSRALALYGLSLSLLFVIVAALAIAAWLA